jgi:hypothetical protein
MSSGATQATGPARGAGVDPAALASDLDEPVVVGERAPVVGAAGADASLAQQRAERAVEARAMLGKKGTPSRRLSPASPRGGRCSGSSAPTRPRRRRWSWPRRQKTSGQPPPRNPRHHPSLRQTPALPC